MSTLCFKVRNKLTGHFLMRPNGCPSFNGRGKAFATSGAARCSFRIYVRLAYKDVSDDDYELVVYEIKEVEKQSI